MKWRNSLGYVLFWAQSAVIAYVTQDRWPQRAILFLVMAVPITLWAIGRTPRKE